MQPHLSLLVNCIASKKQPFIISYATFTTVAPSGNHSVKPLSAVSATVNIPTQGLYTTVDNYVTRG